MDIMDIRVITDIMDITDIRVIMVITFYAHPLVDSDQNQNRMTEL